ncbi:MAG: hypothetical protein WC785_10930 [Tatlockia sp.]|jgi:hypothetical protein
MRTLLEATEYLENVNQVEFPQMLNRYPNDSNDFVNHKPLINELYLLNSQCSKYVQQLEQSNDLSAAAAVNSFKENMKHALKHVESIQANNRRSIPKDIPGEILTHIQKDDAVRLEALLKRCEGTKDILSHYDYALRVAACGSIRCLNYLISTRCANILAPGKSGTIALHNAIDRKRPVCIEALLNATNSHDLFAPSAQLLFGEAPGRPIDYLGKIDDEKIFTKIKNIILTVINGSVGDREMATSQKREEIREILNKQTLQFKLQGLSI